jgi:hypothetical protein
MEVSSTAVRLTAEAQYGFRLDAALKESAHHIVRPTNNLTGRRAIPGLWRQLRMSTSYLQYVRCR